MARGFFISFEGGEGAGKSTQIARLAAKLRAKGYDLVVTREPGGSPGAEAVRHVILSGAAEPFGPEMEAVLFAAARSDHVEQLIAPAIARGSIVLCDRFLDSSRVYQGGAGDLDPGFITALERVAVNGTIPDMTLIFDIDPAEGLRRASARRGDGTPDRFEKETLAVHQRRREVYLAIARSEPERCVVIDASVNPDEVEDAVTTAVFAALEARAAPRRAKEGDVRTYRAGTARHARRRAGTFGKPASAWPSGGVEYVGRCISRRQAAARAAVCRTAGRRQGDAGISPGQAPSSPSFAWRCAGRTGCARPSFAAVSASGDGRTPIRPAFDAAVQ